MVSNWRSFRELNGDLLMSVAQDHLDRINKVLEIPKFHPGTRWEITDDDIRLSVWVNMAHTENLITVEQRDFIRKELGLVAWD